MGLQPTLRAHLFVVRYGDRIAMPGPGKITSPSSTQDPLVRILAEMVDSALRWEAEHQTELVIRESQLTEEPVSIHLNPIDITGADANPESPPEGDTNVPA